MHRTDETTPRPERHAPGDPTTGTTTRPTPATLGARLARIHAEAHRAAPSTEEPDQRRLQP